MRTACLVSCVQKSLTLHIAKKKKNKKTQNSNLVGKLLTVKFSIIKMEFIRQEKLNNLHTGIPRFTLLMWGHIKKNEESENRVNRGYLVVLNGRK